MMVECTSYGSPPLVSRQVGFFANIAFLPAHKMTKFCIYSKRPLQFPQKSGFYHKGSKFRGVAPHYFDFFYIVGVPPLISRQVVLFANITPSVLLKK